MHKPSEPESLRQGSPEGTDAPCICTCTTTREPGSDQPSAGKMSVNSDVLADMNG